jgi:hypothetical protein
MTPAVFLDTCVPPNIRRDFWTTAYRAIDD